MIERIRICNTEGRRVLLPPASALTSGPSGPRLAPRASLPEQMRQSAGSRMGDAEVWPMPVSIRSSIHSLMKMSLERSKVVMLDERSNPMKLQGG